MNLIKLEEAFSFTLEQWGKYYKRYYNPGLYNIFNMLGTSNLDAVSAKGIKIELSDGRHILDYSSAIGILGLGHNHPRIIAAEKKCHEMATLDAIKVAPHRLQGILAYNLSQFLPDPLSISFFALSGAEAVEGALKLCEKIQGSKKRKFITTTGSYHGKTHGSLSITTSGGFRDDFIMGIPSKDIIEVPFANTKILEHELKVNKGSIIAMILEPIQGQGIVVPPKGYLKKVIDLCHKYDVLVIFDEVKAGMGRTGKFCSFQHENVVPDVVTLSKALGGGKRAISAFITTKDLFQKAYGNRKDAGMHTTTFGGLGESCAVAIETLNVLHEKNLINESEKKGKYFIDQLSKLKEKHPTVIKEIKGMGLLLGIKFNYDSLAIRKILNNHNLGIIKTVDSIVIASIVSMLYRKHNIIVHFSNSDLDILHIMPPLIISYDEIDKFIYAIDDILKNNIFTIVLKFIKLNIMRVQTGFK